MSRLKIKIDRTKTHQITSPVEDVEIPVEKIVCKTTRRILVPSVNRLRDLYRESFENPYESWREF